MHFKLDEAIFMYKLIPWVVISDINYFSVAQCDYFFSHNELKKGVKKSIPNASIKINKQL
ncbi:hypothetical protein GCM10022246_10370 [Pedobacter ginsengiterrae]|uniref:Uncharacterized protein n=1 Tax=Pedobacter ginsengiterrae TaxID=871696 RepID=A0ABP7P436_9SPHI